MPRRNPSLPRQLSHLSQARSLENATKIIRAQPARRQYIFIHADVANIFRETRKRELNITTDTNVTAINNLSSLSLSPLAQPRGRGSSADQAKIARNRGSLEENIQESDLVRQLIFVFGNTASTEIIDSGDGYQLRPSLNVSETVKRMIGDLS
jgi:hypothetical protein